MCGLLETAGRIPMVGIAFLGPRCSLVRVTLGREAKVHGRVKEISGVNSGTLVGGWGNLYIADSVQIYSPVDVTECFLTMCLLHERIIE